MHRLRKFYYDNKYKIWGVIAFIVLLLAIIQILNNLVANTNNINIANSNTSNTINDLNSGNKNTYVTNDESIINGGKIDSTELEDASKIIEEFISECNNGNIEQAYNLLTEDCKDEMYQDINKFRDFYYNKIFTNNSKKIATIENWTANTYIVNISDDIMATGGSSENSFQDYITIEEEDDILKISLNNFIGKEELNEVKNIDNIEFQIIEKSVYIDYEIYTIKVINNTTDNIILDDLSKPKAIYLEDSNGMKYYSYSSEIIPSLLKVNRGFSTQFDIKFSREYSTDRAGINSLVFSEAILNSDENNQNEEKSKIIINF